MTIVSEVPAPIVVAAVMSITSPAAKPEMTAKSPKPALVMAVNSRLAAPENTSGASRVSSLEQSSAMMISNVRFAGERAIERRQS